MTEERPPPGSPPSSTAPLVPSAQPPSSPASPSRPNPSAQPTTPVVSGSSTRFTSMLDDPATLESVPTIPQPSTGFADLLPDLEGETLVGTLADASQAPDPRPPTQRNDEHIDGEGDGDISTSPVVADGVGPEVVAKVEATPFAYEAGQAGLAGPVPPVQATAPTIQTSAAQGSASPPHWQQQEQNDDRDELDLLTASQIHATQARMATPPPTSAFSVTPDPLSPPGPAALASPAEAPQAEEALYEAESSRDVPAGPPEVPDVQMAEIPPQLLQPSPPRRALRSRKPGQLIPYTIEMAMYKRRLERNDWEDAVVTDQQFRRRMREERERAAADELHVASSDWQLREAEAEQRRERRRAKKAEQAKQDAEAQASARSPDRSNAVDERSTASKDKSSNKRRRIAAQKGPTTDAIFARFGGVLSDGEDDNESQAVSRGTPNRTHRSATDGRAARRRSNQSGQGEGSSTDSQDIPHPPGSTRKRPLRRVNSAGAVSISSSDDDIDRSREASRQIRRVSIGSASSSSSEESMDYDRYFRQLKRMMPIHMARKHIDDLKNMRKGKAYHSDGHVSETPEPSEAGSGSESDAGRAATTPGTSPLTTHELQPGEARKRIRPAGAEDGQRDDARFDLIGDEGSETSDGELSVLSSASSSSSRGNVGGREDADIRWWTRPEPDLFSHARTRRSNVDEVDRMLSRSTTARPAKRRPKTGIGASRRRAAQGSRPSGSSRSSGSSSRTPLQQRTVNERSSGSKQHSSSRKHRGAQQVRVAGPRLPPRGKGFNPPVVQPRSRPRLDLLADDVLFDIEVLPAMASARVIEQGTTEGQLEESHRAIASYKATNRPNRPIIRRNRPPANPAVVNALQPTEQDNVPHITTFNGTRRELVRTSSRSSAGEPVAIDVNTSRSLTKRSEGLNRLVQQRLDSRGILRRNGADSPKSPAPSPHQLDANAWADLANLRLDFGIRPLPPGVSFSPATSLGKGRLHELITLPEEQGGAARAWSRLRPVYALGLDLPTSIEPDGLLDLLPSIFDAIFTVGESISTADEEATRNRMSLDEVLRYLSLSMTALLQMLPWREMRHVIVAVQHQIDHLFERFESAGIGSEEVDDAAKQPVASLMLALRWFNVEICWRSVASQRAADVDYDESLAEEEEFVLACQGVMTSLLSHGLHQTMREVKSVCASQSHRAHSEVGDEPQAYVDDYSAEIWINLIHILSTAATVLGPHAGFWPVFEASLAQWRATLPPRRKVLTAEMIWYSVLSLCALSQFSASTGTTGSTPLLAQHWPLIVQALTATKLRYEEAVEQAMPSAAVSKRDQYIRAIVQRCFNLVSLWQWKMDGADTALSKLFDIFNEHRLADLPSEEDHDFPPFLREYDARLLFDESKREATSYHIFLKLLARAGRDLQATAKDPRDAERRVARLFSRVCPVRVMSFTRASPPTSRERSSLFNHYAVVMTHLYLMPSASAQRLRQIKSFLVFKDADAQSQVTCIRAMLYAAVIFRHYELDISAIATWFGTIFKTLLVEAEDVNRLSAKNEPGNHFESLRQARRVNSLLLTSLRSIQHIIEHQGLREQGGTSAQRMPPTPMFPDIQLLDRAWTSNILESQTAIDPAVGMEVLKCIQVCLLHRNTCMDAVTDRSTVTASGGGQVQNASGMLTAARNADQGESQDSFGQLFEDVGDDAFDFSDPALDDMLGDNAAAAAREERLAALREADMALAKHLRDNISPSFFRLLSNIYHPDRQSEGRRISLGLSDTLRASEDSHRGGRQHLENLLQTTTRRRYVELLIDCWAGCAHVLVQNGLRDWHGYLTYGNESWKRLVDATGKRDVGLRFLQNVAVLDPSAYHAHKSEFLQVWFHAAAARSLSVQADFTRTLFEEIDPEMPWLRASLAHIRSEAVDNGEDGQMTLESFQRHRTLLVSSAVGEMARDFRDGGRLGAAQRRPMIFSCLSGFLSAMRSQLENLPVRDSPSAAGSVDQYLVFCRETTRAISEKGGETILRGVKGELDRTVALVERTTEVRAIPLATALGM